MDPGRIRSTAAIVVFVCLDDKLRSFKITSLMTLIHTKENEKKFDIKFAQKRQKHARKEKQFSLQSI